ncbi:MAG: VWA domain-containing protein [Phycisphaerales bacterium]|nr:MAG: VWA domain-containing protein [Phycisphaerales bacterium]
MNAKQHTVVGRSSLVAVGSLALLCSMGMPAGPAMAGGTLTPVGSPHQPVQILDHHVDVVLNNGFARTEVIQSFYNPNDTDLEAVYAFPVPKSASLSEVTIYIDEREIHGEVLPKDEAEQIYEEEKDKGNDAGLAKKNTYQTFEFRVHPVRANAETRLRFVYYQPIELDTGVGRYVYPLEDGGTDEVGASFWLPNEKVEGTFSVDVEIKYAYAIDDVRVPGLEAATLTEKLDEGHYRLRTETQEAALNRDFVVYYRLADGLPGRVELIAYRDAPDHPGTFMLVVTPGLDLQPITWGADYIFVLDKSGSMKGKLGTLVRGVAKSLGELRGEDRFRIITFDSRARDLTRGWITASVSNVQSAIKDVESLSAGGSTNMYEGLELALRDLHDDRATSVVLVTDAVTNTGIVDPAAFQKLMAQYDIRLFGFLMGNSANWPLMRVVAETSGGFYASVSNADDIIGQILLAKSKITHECLHDAQLSVRGVKTFDVTDPAVGKVYRGQQLVLFGRYAEGGEATVALEARLTGEDRTYSTTFSFPDTDTENPELERLWAMNRIEAIEALQLVGAVPPSEAEEAIEDLGVAYQLVTDETSMVVLSDEAFAQRGIDRANQRRIAWEQQARSVRDSQPVRNHRVDRQQPMFQHPSPRPSGGGGGAFDPFSAIAAIGFAGWVASRIRRQRRAASEGRQVS